MTVSKDLLRAGLLLGLLASGCAGRTPERAGAAEPPQPALALADLERPSPAAAAVAAFNAICAEPARRPVGREAGRRGFAPAALAELRAEMPDAAFPPEALAWRGPAEAGGAVALWDGATGTCAVRARGVDPVVVDAEFAKLPQALEEAGAAVLRLAAPPVRAGAARTRQMLLVTPGGGGAPERARVLRLGDGGGTDRDAVVLSARSVSGAEPAAAR